MLDVNREIGQRSGDRELSQQVAGLTALADLKETLSQERALLYSVASVKGPDNSPVGGRFRLDQAQEFSSAIARRQAALSRFRADSTPAQREQYDELVNGQAVLAVKRLEDSVLRAQNSPSLGLDAQQWYSAATTYLQAMREVEVSLLDQVVATTRELRSDAQRQAITTGVIIAAILVIAFLTSLLIARMLTGPLRRLEAGARDVAEIRLPEAIARLRRTDAAPAPMEVEPIPIDTRDEIGEVAARFDALHRRAVELATEQAALRNNVNAMFVNLSRRSQGLVERQLKLIDELETGEQDPDQLANLFKLDHLATRMRRNSENLLVLAGEDAGRRWGRPIPLVDVLRAATSEVEQYHRIQLTGVPDVEVMGHAVNHVVHLVAELLENATVFSSPESKVLVHSQRLSDGGAMVEIEDRGIGMSGQEIADANERLARPPVFDVSISRMMGLYVVGRLAGRHGITVRLRQSETGGVSAFVRIPLDVLASRFEQRPDDPAAAGAGAAGGAAALGGPGGPGGPGQDGRLGRPGAVGLPPPPGVLPLPAGPGPRPGVGPAADLPRRALPQPGGPPEQPPAVPGGTPLPRRTPGGDSPGVDTPMLPAAGVNGTPNGHPGNGVPPTIGGATRADLAGPPAPPFGGPQPAPPFGGPQPAPPPGGPQQPFGAPAQPFGGPPTGSYGLPAAPGREERTPIFEQLQSEWFRQRPASRPPGSPDAPAAADGADGARPDGSAPAAQPPAAAAPATGPDRSPARSPARSRGPSRPRRHPARTRGRRPRTRAGAPPSGCCSRPAAAPPAPACRCGCPRRTSCPVVRTFRRRPRRPARRPTVPPRRSAAGSPAITRVSGGVGTPTAPVTTTATTGIATRPMSSSSNPRSSRDLVEPRGPEPQLARHQLRRPGARCGALGGGVGRRPVAGVLGGVAARPRRPAGRRGVRADQPDPGCRPLLRGRQRGADGDRDGAGLPVPHVDQRRLLPGGARGDQLRRRPGRLRDGAAGRAHG